jgi:hypothetical protein
MAQSIADRPPAGPAILFYQPDRLLRAGTRSRGVWKGSNRQAPRRPQQTERRAEQKTEAERNELHRDQPSRW